MRGASEQAGDIDRRITEKSEHWRLERMPAVDRNILRLAVYEMTGTRYARAGGDRRGAGAGAPVFGRRIGVVHQRRAGRGSAATRQLPEAHVDPCCQRDALQVVLVAPRNPLNIGAAARAMSNFGVSRTAPGESLRSRVSRGELRRESAAACWKRRARIPTVEEAVADCELVVGTTSKGHRALEHPLRRLWR